MPVLLLTAGSKLAGLAETFKAVAGGGGDELVA